MRTGTTRVGFDLTSLGEVQDALATHGDRYLQRIYDDGERRDAAGRASWLAACFAAKEATMKALGMTDPGLPWRSVAVRRDRAGAARIELLGAARDRAAAAGVRSLAVSFTLGRRTAAAVVLAELER